MKKLIIFLGCFVISVVIALISPMVFNNNIDVAALVSDSYVEQNIIGYADENIVNYKVYNRGKLIGVVKDKKALLNKVKNSNLDFGFDYDKNKVGLIEDVYIINEFSKLIYEDKDDEIYNYLLENDCLGLDTNCIEFSTDGQINEKIYVLNIDDFINARDQFILNFVSQETLNNINSGVKINSPENFGSVDVGVNIKDKIDITTGIGTFQNIMKDENEVYQFLCYGRSEERQYYTTIEGDTVAGVGRFFNNMSAKQIMSINHEIIKDENQILEPGTVLNVTYFNSPITIYVEKERLTQEVMFPDPVVYLENASLPIGQVQDIIEEKNGVRNVLYSETWINGVLQSGVEKSSVVIVAPVQGQKYIGAGSIVHSDTAGSGNWHWPVSTPTITCNYTCYAGHGGVDFYNLYNPWDYALAADSGVVIDTGWTDIGGYYARIDHNNGFVTYYGHFSQPAFVEVGQSVSAGEILGSIGMTGNATGPHVHFALYRDGLLIDPCSELNCSLLY